MAVYTDKVVLELEAKLSKYHADLLSGQRKFDQIMDNMTKKLKSTESQSVASFGRMSTILTSIGGALGVAQVLSYADAWTKAQNSLAVAGVVGENQKRVLDQLYESAQRNATPINALTELYGRAAQASDVLGASQEELVQFSDGVAVALRVAGTDANAASGALLQLGQALGNSKVQAEEFNSINEGARPILMAVAAGIKETGGSVSNLRKMMLDGNLTAKMFFDGFLAGAPAIQEMADRTSATVAQGFTRISNAVTKYVGELNQGAGATGTLISLMDGLANNFELVANGSLVTAGIILTRYIPSLAAATKAQVAMIATNPFLLLAAAIGTAATVILTFGDEIKVVEGDLANLNDYGMAAFDTIKGAASEAASSIGDVFNDMVSVIVGAFEGVGVSWEDVVSFIKAASNRIIGTVHAVHRISVAVLTGIPTAIADAVISAMQFMIDIVESGLNKIVEATNKVIRGLQSIPGIGGQIGGEFEGVDLGNIPNPAAGALRNIGEEISSAVDDALHRDYIGEGVQAATDFASGWRKKANERAAVRAVGDINDLLLGGSGSSGSTTLPPSASDDGKGKKGKKGAKGKESYDFSKDLLELKQRTEALNAETDALSKLDPLAEDYETQVTKIRTEQELLNKAAKEGIALSPAQRAAITAMADAYAQADEQARKLKETQEESQRKQQEWVDTQKAAMKGFITDLASGKDAMDALGNAVAKLADKLLDLAIDGLFDGKGSGGGGFLSSIASGISSLFGRRAGGGGTQKGVPYFVNENTPNSELYVPSESGAVLTIPQAQDALARAASNQFGSGRQVASASRQTMSVTQQTHMTFSLEGANGDQAIEDAVNRGIRKAAPQIQNNAIKGAAKLVGEQSRTGSKGYLGIR